jgi:hypothetical protein
MELETKPRKNKEGKTIWVATREAEPVKIPISRESHRRQLIAQKDYCIDQILKLKDKIRDIEAMICRMDEHEAEGMIVRCFDNGDHLSYEAVEKPPLGFRTDTKDASTWQQEQERKHGKRQ